MYSFEEGRFEGKILEVSALLTGVCIINVKLYCLYLLYYRALSSIMDPLADQISEWPAKRPILEIIGFFLF